MADEEEKGQN